MRVLWIVNLVSKDICTKYGLASENLGGWVDSMAAQLGVRDEIELAIACKCDPGIGFSEKLNGVTYYSVAYSSSTSL